MTLRLFNGFETPRLNFFPGSSTSYAPGRTGMCVNLPQGSANNTVGFPMLNLSAFTLGFAWRRLTRTNSNDGDSTIITFEDGQDAVLFLIHNYDTGTVTITRRQGVSSLIILGTASVPIAVNIWTYIEIRAQLSTDTTTPNGSLEIRFDGNTVFTYTGVLHRWTSYVGSAEWNTSNYSASQVDDFYICDHVDATATQGRAFDNFLGPVRIEALRPVAAGDSTQWVGSDGNSVDNHLLVDDPNQPDTSDYIEATATGTRDLYQFADPTYSGKVLALDILSHCSAPEGGSPKLKSVVKDGAGTVVVGPGTVPAPEWATRSDTIFTKAPDGDFWTTGKVAAAQFGLEIESEA